MLRPNEKRAIGITMKLYNCTVRQAIRIVKGLL